MAEYYYVTINQILNGRSEYHKLAEWTRDSGVGEVDYFHGGWHDSVNGTVRPHVRFTREEDALAFMLHRGGDYSRKIPVA